MNQKPFAIIAELMKQKVMATVNQTMLEFGHDRRGRITAHARG